MEQSNSRIINHEDPDTLERLYHGEGKTLEEIAELSEVSSTTILRRMRKFGVETRGREHNEGRRLEYASYYTDKRGYERWVCWDPENEKTETVRVHRLAAVAWFGFEAVVGNDAHHKNGHKWDNREENIGLMSRGEHISKHRIEDGSLRTKLADEDVIQIKRLLDEGEHTHREIASMFGVNQSHISDIKNGRHYDYISL